MPEYQNPTHGFLPAILVSLGYVGLSFGLAVAVTTVLPDRFFLVTLLLAALALLAPFARVARRVVPETPTTR